MEMCFEIEFFPGSIDLRACLTSGQVFRWKEIQPNTWAGVDGGHWYVVRETPKSFHVNSNGNESDFRRLFRLDQDWVRAERDLLSRGPELTELLRRWKGLRVLRQSDPAETLFCFLCTANNHIPRITSMIAKLAAYGESFVERPEMRKFPTSEEIAEIGEAKLRDLGFGYRAKSITKAAHFLLDQPEDWLKSLRDRSYAEAHESLLQVPGVGPKLADCIALFGLDIQTSVPKIGRASCRERV